MYTSIKQALLPCDKVLGTQELLESIVPHLDLDDPAYLRLLAAICRRWYNYFEPYIWRKVIAQTWGRHTSTNLQHHGCYIKDLSCHRVDLGVLKSISTYAISLESLGLFLDQHSILITYDQLEKTFLQTQECLTAVSITLDASVLDVSLLWTLSRLPRLAHLSLVICGDIDMAALHVEVLRCCPGLESLKLDHRPPIASRSLLNRLAAIIQRKVASRGIYRKPTTVRETVERDRPAPGRHGSTLLVVQPVGHLPSTPQASANAKFHQSDLCGFSADTSVLVELAKTCSSLHGLHLWDGLTVLDIPSWTTLSSHRLSLQDLRLTGHMLTLHSCEIMLLITKFPQLESLHVHFHSVLWDTWSIDNLNDSFAEHQQKYGTRHPLKTLTLTGNYSIEFPLLLIIMTARSNGIETLTTGGLWRSQKDFGADPFHETSVSSFLTSSMHGLIFMEWYSLKDTLTQLDLHTQIVPTKITRTFLYRLHELSRLRALCLSTRQINDWVTPSLQVSHFLWKGQELPITQLFSCSNSSLDNNIHSSTSSSGDFHPIKLPTRRVSYPSLQEFVVKIYPYGHCGLHRNITGDHAIFVLAAMPALEHFVLEEGAIDEDKLDALKNVFPI